MQNLTEQEKIRRQKVEKLRQLGYEPWQNFDNKDVKNFSEQIKQTYAADTRDELEKAAIEVSLSGRIMLMREPFFVINDSLGPIQIYFNRKTQTQFVQLFDLLDIGDIVYLKGTVFKTQKDEVTIRLNHLELLTKSLIPLPEKYHGLKDVEERYRKRYLDLMMNDEVKQTFKMRSHILKLFRDYFDRNSFMEVETPILHAVLGGANARPFITHHNALNQRFNLRIATELPLKQLLVGGFDRVYEIGRIFRNEGIDTTHNPEFTSIEFYQAYANMETMMELTEGIFKYVAFSLQKSIIEFNGQKIHIDRPFARLNMVDAVCAATETDFRNISFEKALEIAKKYRIELKSYFTIGHIINGLFEELIESKLIQPTFVYGHPIEVSPFARKSSDPRFTDRAELFINTKEYANLFTELTDPLDQRSRFEAQLGEKAAGNDETVEIDEIFLNALEYGLPPAGGSGIGIDRFIMLFTQKESIREVLLFPTLKHQ